MKFYYVILAFLMLCFTGRAQLSDFSRVYRSFQEKFESTNMYSLHADINIFSKSGRSINVKYEVRMNEGAYFMKMDDTERIINDEMVITTSIGMKSIIISERNDEGFQLFKSDGYFKILDSLQEVGVISQIKKDNLEVMYSIDVNKEPYERIHITFKNNVLSQMDIYYRGKDIDYSHVIVDFNIDFTPVINDHMFSINRYAYVENGQYKLKSAFRDFELSLY